MWRIGQDRTVSQTSSLFRQVLVPFWEQKVQIRANVHDYCAGCDSTATTHAEELTETAREPPTSDVSKSYSATFHQHMYIVDW